MEGAFSCQLILAHCSGWVVFSNFTFSRSMFVTLWYTVFSGIKDLCWSMFIKWWKTENLSGFFIHLAEEKKGNIKNSECFLIDSSNKNFWNFLLVALEKRLQVSICGPIHKPFDSKPLFMLQLAPWHNTCGNFYFRFWFWIFLWTFYGAYCAPFLASIS